MKEIITSWKAEFLEKKNSFFLLFCTLCFTLLRIPSLVEPDWYGDEGIYQVIGVALRQGRILYKGIWDNKPPILYLLYAFVNGELFWIRFLSLCFGVLSIIAFFYLARKIFNRTFALFVSTIVFSFLFALPLLEGNIANAENFMLLPIIIAFYLIIPVKEVSGRSEKVSFKQKPAHLFLAGILLSAAFLTKIVAIFDFFALFILILAIKYYQKSPFSLKNTLRNIIHDFSEELIFSLSFAAPIILTFIYFFVNGALGDYIRAAFFQNVGYVGYGNALHIGKTVIPQGLLLLKLFLLFSAICIAFLVRKKLLFSGLIIFIWTACSLFDVFFASRPYTHYLLMFLPAFSLLVGYIFDRLEKKHGRKIRLGVLISVCALSFILYKNFIIYKKNALYYKNYLEFVFGGKSSRSYQAFFDRKTPRDYELAEFIRKNTTQNDNIFLWSDSAQIYVLAHKLPPGRYAASYHILFYPSARSETKKELDRFQPKYIIDTKHSDIKEFLDGYEKEYEIEDAIIYGRKT